MPDFLLRKESNRERIRAGFSGMFLFSLSLAIFFFSLAGFGGLALLNRAQNAAREEIKEQIRAKEEGIRPELIQQVILLDQRLTNMRNLLSRHVFASNVLDVIETVTHPQTRFTNFTLNSETRRIDMAGETASYLTLAQQIGFLEKNGQIERVEFGNLSLAGTNRLGFKMAVMFKPGLLQIRP